MPSSQVVPWQEVLDYFKDLREQVIAEMSLAQTDRQLWAAQGKLAQIDELLNLRAIFDTLAEQKVELARHPAPVSLRARVEQKLGADGATLLYGKDHGAKASEGG